MDGLDARISAAFGDAVKSADVGILLKDVEQAVVASGDMAEKARARALDPTLADNAVDAARERMNDHAFRRDRMSAALEKLRLRLVELRDQEEDARRRASYDAAAKNRDDSARELSEFYPGMAEKLVALLSRLQQSNYELGQVNAKLPNGAPRLELAEFVAKNIVGRPIAGFESVLDGCRVSPWHPHSPHRWPP